MSMHTYIRLAARRRSVLQCVAPFLLQQQTFLGLLHHNFSGMTYSIMYIFTHIYTCTHMNIATHVDPRCICDARHMCRCTPYSKYGQYARMSCICVRLASAHMSCICTYVVHHICIVDRHVYGYIHVYTCMSCICTYVVHHICIVDRHVYGYIHVYTCMSCICTTDVVHHICTPCICRSTMRVSPKCG